MAEMAGILIIKYKNSDGSFYWDQKEIKNIKSEVFKKCWALDNLQPMWEADNIRKSNKDIVVQNINMSEYNNLQHPEFISDQIRRMTSGLDYSYDMNTMLNEINNINNYTSDKFTTNSSWNKIVLTYQPHFFEKEQELWKNPDIQYKILLNREKYLFKSRHLLNDKEILRGFKISGIHVGFSHFSPLWIKGFIEKYNIKSIYDPCGGWGHRLLGTGDIEYIYNDIDKKTCDGVIKIINDFNLLNKKVYNNDASTFIPEENYECVFTCPPYFNIEKYDCENTSTNAYPEYQRWLNIWWRNVIKCSVKPDTKYFAFVINNQYKDDMIKVCIEESLSLVETIKVGSSNNRNHFQRVSGNSFKGEQIVILKNK
jgi:hypothetical protein